MIEKGDIADSTKLLNTHRHVLLLLPCKGKKHDSQKIVVVVVHVHDDDDEGEVKKCSRCEKNVKTNGERRSRRGKNNLTCPLLQELS